jgi:acetyl esterase/lipase
MRLLPIVLLTALAPLTPALKRDIVYGRAGGVDLKLDFVEPDGGGPFPTVICIHGGAWSSGSKSGYTPVLEMLAMRGYAAAAVEYRFAPAYKFPAQLDDARIAVEYLRAHAAELKIDATRMVVMGDSAGGHLALMIGLKDHVEGLRGVINLCGPSDITRWRAAPAGEKAIGMTTDRLLETVFGTSDRNSDALKSASPLNFVSKDSPAVLTLHGDADPTVKLEQSEWLHEALRKAGATEKLVVLKGARHGLEGAHVQTAIAAVLEFLAAQEK